MCIWILSSIVKTNHPRVGGLLAFGLCCLGARTAPLCGVLIVVPLTQALEVLPTVIVGIIDVVDLIGEGPAGFPRVLSDPHTCVVVPLQHTHSDELPLGM